MVFSANIFMADFPPNLEDGELWIPSDIIHEITYSSDLPPPPPPPPTTFCPNLPSNDFKVHYGFMGVNSDDNYITNDGSFYGDHRSGFAALYGRFQLTPPPISPYYVPISQHITQGLEEKGGTGVFLPRVVVAECEETSNGGGGGVLFKYRTKNKKSGKRTGAFRCGNEKKSSIKEGGSTKKDKSQSQHPTKKLLTKD